VPAVVEWKRGPLGPLAKHPLKDNRVRIETVDVAVTLTSRLGNSMPCCSTWTMAQPQ
jgi:hypothetical protein